MGYSPSSTIETVSLSSQRILVSSHSSIPWILEQQGGHGNLRVKKANSKSKIITTSSRLGTMLYLLTFTGCSSNIHTGTLWDKCAACYSAE
eukprot:6212504-Pleurochrysis_carterae.AAC.1